MNKTKKIITITADITLLGLVFFLYEKFLKPTSDESNSVEQTFYNNYVYDMGEFSDGLQSPDSETTYPLDESETGKSKKYVYDVDINNDGKPDRITKTYFENGNAHSYYKYSVELNQSGVYKDITPNNLQTTNGADCDLQQIQFRFKPRFEIIVIYREMGDTWNTPTMAYKKIYSWQKDVLTASAPTQIEPICDVKELF